MSKEYSYLKFIWEYKAIILPLFLWVGVILDFANVSLVVPRDYLGISYSVEINATEIVKITIEAVKNIINYIGDFIHGIFRNW